MEAIDMEKRLSIKGPSGKDIEKILMSWDPGEVNLDFRERFDAAGSFTGVVKRKEKDISSIALARLNARRGVQSI